MKMLICIANYGEDQLSYLDIVLKEYALFSEKFDISVVLFSTQDNSILKTRYPKLKIKEFLYQESIKMMLPNCHKKYMAENVENYDLFVYAENDLRITNRNVEKFLELSRICEGTKYVPSFLRFEICRGNDFVSVVDMHYKHSRWGGGKGGDQIVKEVVTVNHHNFFTPYNIHSGMYILTRNQLKRVVDNVNFYSTSSYVRPLESSASGVYVNCGIQKVISYPFLNDLLIHHLPNKYCSLSFSLDTLRRVVEQKMKDKICQKED